MYLIIAFYKNWWNLIVFRPKPTGELEAQVFLLSLMSVTFITFHQVLIIVQRDERFIPFVICSNPHQWPVILLLYLRFLKLFPERVALAVKVLPNNTIRVWPFHHNEYWHSLRADNAVSRWQPSGILLQWRCPTVQCLLRVTYYRSPLPRTVYNEQLNSPLSILW